MRIGLFIPCYLDQFYPQVGLATADVLERLGMEIECPARPTCCGQPMANTGCADDAAPLARQFVETFADRKYEFVVCPSGSCTSMIRHHYREFVSDRAALDRVSKKTFEFCEFLTDVLHVDSRHELCRGPFPYRVGLHNSCHGLRELRLGKSSETVAEPFNKTRSLLEGLRGVELTTLSRPDECCGFGGTFAVTEEAVSCQMGRDRVADHRRAGAEIITAADMSCLMHMDGLIRREKLPLRVMHVAEILSASISATDPGVGGVTSAGGDKAAASESPAAPADREARA